MAEKVSKLNVFLADLAVMNIKVHNLHWNVVGMEFKSVHKMTEKIYETLQAQFDQTAELMRMQDKLPLAAMADYLKNSQVEEIESREYSTLEVLELLDQDCDTLMNQAKQVREEADKNDDFLTVNLMEEFLAVYAKKSWMLKSMLRE